MFSRAETNISRRTFLGSLTGAALGVGLMEGCVSKPLTLTQMEPLHLDFYGLFHYEPLEDFEQTLSNIVTALESRPPELITLELRISLEELEEEVEYAGRYIREAGAIAREHNQRFRFNFDNYIQAIALPYQGLNHYRQAWAWGKDHHVPVEPVDLRHLWNWEGEEIKGTIPERFDREMERLRSLSALDFAREAYRIGRRVPLFRQAVMRDHPLIRSAYLGNPQDPSLMPEAIGPYLVTDHETAELIEQHAVSYQANHIAHFGGASHFLSHPDGLTLYDYFKDKAIITRALLTPAPPQLAQSKRSNKYSSPQYLERFI